MQPNGQTPPLDKCEQLDLKHPKAMLQNEICPQNYPQEGGEGFRLLAHGLYSSREKEPIAGNTSAFVPYDVNKLHK